MQLLWRLFRTDWRAGDLRLLFAALFLAVAVITGLTAFIERLQIMLVGESSQFLAADRVLESPRPVDDSWLALAERHQLRQARYLSFQSMAYADDRPQLVSVKAADDAYPLRGLLHYRQTLFGDTRKTVDGPRPGEIWAEARLFSQLGLAIGDTVAVGDGDFVLAAELVSEPDRGAGSISMGPRVLMHWDDIASTGVVQLGSRLSYHYLFAGLPQQLAALEVDLLPLLTDSHEWQDLDNSQPTVALALRRAKTFFMLASSIIVILSGIAIAMASSRFSLRHRRHVAVLKTLGATSAVIQRLYFSLLALVASLAIVMAGAAGWLLQEQVLQFAGQALHVDVPPLSPRPFVLGLLTALISLGCFSLPPLWALKNVSAISIFQQQASVLPSFSLPAVLLALAGILLLLWAYTGNVFIGLLLLGGLAALLLLVTLPAWLLLKRLESSRLQLTGWATLALSNLQRRLRSNALHMALFAISMMLLMVLWGVKNNLFSEWQNQLPPKTPNFFLVNIEQGQLDGVRQWLADGQIDSESLYPMVRGRLVAINGQPVRELVSKEQLKRAGADRELNLSWANELPPDNTLTAGDWHVGDGRQGGVSVESELAQKLAIGIGDTLTFMIGGEQFDSEVASLREVEWDRMRPNFYMLLDQQQLAPFAKTWMTSFWLPAERHGEVSQLLKAFPTVIVIDVDAVIRQIRTIIDHVTLALELVLVFVLAGSLLVLMTTVQNGLAERVRENTVIRALGGTRRLIVGSLLAEFALMGLLAGVLATVFGQIILLVVQARVLTIPLQLHPELWWMAPLGGMLLIGGAGFWSARQVSQVAPMRLLSQQS